MDRTLARGLFLLVISLAFGLQSLRYPIGQFSRAGAGLFPLMISSLLLLIALITLVRSRFVKEREQMDFNAKNIGLIMLSLCGFALVSHFINMIAGIAFMVFVSAFAGQTYSVTRNLKVVAGLVVIAYGFHKLLSLNLPLP